MEKVNNTKKTLKIIGNVAFWVILILVVFYSMLALFSEQDENRTSFLGSSALSVQSDSMSPTFDKGDLIFIDTTFELNDLEVGDVITYRMTVNTNDGPVQIYNSHRIIEIREVGGVLWFDTQGDNNNSPDVDAVYQNEIIGVWKGTAWANFGTFADSFIGFLKSSVGFLLFIVLPCFAFLVYEVVRFVKVVSDYNVQKAVGDRVQLEQEAIAIARAQLEAEALAKEKAKETKEE